MRENIRHSQVCKLKHFWEIIGYKINKQCNSLHSFQISDYANIIRLIANVGLFLSLKERHKTMAI